MTKLYRVPLYGNDAIDAIHPSDYPGAKPPGILDRFHRNSELYKLSSAEYQLVLVKMSAGGVARLGGLAQCAEGTRTEGLLSSDFRPLYNVAGV